MILKKKWDTYDEKPASADYENSAYRAIWAQGVLHNC